MGGEEIQARLYAGKRLRPGPRRGSGVHGGLQGRWRAIGRLGARAAAEPGLRALYAAREGRQARCADGFHSRGQHGNLGDEDLCGPRPRERELEPKRTLDIFKHWTNPDRPRGPIAMEPETRDIVQNEYLREVRKVNGQLANVEIETVAKALKDPWKELKKGK